MNALWFLLALIALLVVVVIAAGLRYWRLLRDDPEGV